MRPRAPRRETTSAMVDRSREIRWPSVRWSRFGSLYNAFSAANWGDVIVCDTSSFHNRFIACTARRSRWPGCCIRSSGAGCESGGSLLTLLLHTSITAEQQSLARGHAHAKGAGGVLVVPDRLQGQSQRRTQQEKESGEKDDSEGKRQPERIGLPEVGRVLVQLDERDPGSGAQVLIEPDEDRDRLGDHPHADRKLRSPQAQGDE